MGDSSRRHVAGTIGAVLAMGCVLLAGCGPASNIALDTVLTSPARTRYVDENLGYALQLPARWVPDRYRVQTYSDGEAAAHQLGALSVVDFAYLPADEKLEEATLLRLMVYAEADWTDLTGERGFLPGEVLGRFGGRVYVAAVSRKQPYPADTADADTYREMLPTVDQLRAGLRPWNGEGSTPTP